jgi:hypothetical protein
MVSATRTPTFSSLAVFSSQDYLFPFEIFAYGNVQLFGNDLPQCLLLKWVVVKYTLTGVQGRKKNFSRSLCKTPLFNDGNGERPCPLR